MKKHLLLFALLLLISRAMYAQTPRSINSSPELTVSTESLTGFTYDYGNGPSDAQSFTVSGTDLPEIVTVSVSNTYFKVCDTEEGTYTQSLTLTTVSGSLSATAVYVRMVSGLAVGSYTDDISIIYGTNLSASVTLSGSVNANGTVETPTFSPDGGNYNAAQTVSINCETDGATIHYTTDGNNPTQSSPTYNSNSPLSIDQTTTVKAIAMKEGYNDSEIAEATYTINIPVLTVSPTLLDDFTYVYGEGPSQKTFTVSGSNLPENVNVSVSDNNSNFKVSPTDGGVFSSSLILIPNNDGYLSATIYVQMVAGLDIGSYNGNISVTCGTSLSGGVTLSGSVNAIGTVGTPTFSPDGGNYNAAQTVNISCTTQYATIRYTLDGSDPTQNSPLYNSPLSINQPTTVKAKAWKDGYQASEVAEATYSFTYTITTSVNPTGTGTVTGGGPYNYGTTCNLTATPETGYHFVNWTEDGQAVQGATNNPYSFTVYGPRNLVANFEAETYTVTLNTNGGTINSGNVTSYTYGEGAILPTDVTKEGHNFDGWYDNSSFTGSPVTSIPPTATGNKVFWAKWTPIPCNITTNVNPTGAGTVAGAGTYDYGTTCSLTATANYGYNFVNWTKNGAQVSTETTYSFPVTESAQYVANFTAQNYTISASADPSAGGEISGSGGYNYGDNCTLTATVNTGYTFINWTKNGTEVSTNLVYTFTVTESATYVAHFVINYYDITTEVTPANAGTVSGGGHYEYNTSVTLTASENYGYSFSHWHDGVTQNPRSITVTQNATYTAEFTPNQYTITTNVTPTGAGTVSGGGTHDYGTTVTLTATANYGYHFSQWSDGITQNPRQIVVTENATYTAEFAPNLYTITTEVTPIDTAGTVTGGGTYNYNTPATLTATPSTGYHFNNWTVNGQVVQTNTNYSFTVTHDSTMVANFEINSYTITANANPSNAGTVSGGGTYTHGQTATLMATANLSSHRHFDHWEDGSTDNPRQITVTNNGTYTAYFEWDQHTITVNADPDNGGTVTGGGTYNWGDQITLEATASPGYRFTQWQDGNTQNPRQIMVNGDATYTAHFTEEIYQIEVLADPVNGGTVTGGGAFHYGDTPTLYATANSGYTFQGWNDGITDNPRQITVTGNATYTAVFGEVGVTYYNVTATVDPEGAGTVTGTGPFPAGSTTTLQANANTGYTFNHWDDGNTQNPRTVTVNSNLSFTAYFTQNTYTITTHVDPTGAGMVTGGGNNFHYGDQTTLNAIANEGYEFGHWNDGITQNPRTITVTGNATYTAYFDQVAVPEYTITVNANPTDGGEVEGNGTYPAGTQVILKARANDGYFFDHWNDGNILPQREITVTGNATYTAYFERQTYTIETVVKPEGSGEVTGGGTYPEGTEVQLTANPNPGYEFDRWNDNVADNPRWITVTRDATYTATFTPILYTIHVVANPEDGGHVELDNGLQYGQYMYGDTCTVKARENAGYTFANWEDENGYQYSNELIYSFVVTGDLTLVANFAGADQHIVYVDIDPSEGGTATGAGVYNHDEECTLKAFAKLGYHFVNWTINEGVVSEVPTYTFRVTETSRYAAHFEKNKYNIAAVADPDEGGDVTGGGIYYHGTTCTLTATPKPNYRFLNWTDSDGIIASQDSLWTFVVTADGSYTAHFGVEATYTIRVQAEPEEGGTAYIGEDGTYEMTFDQGQACTVIAQAYEDYSFVRWTENNVEVSTDSVYLFTVEVDRNLVAHFRYTKQYIITATSNNSEWGTVDGAGSYYPGESCTLNAKPKEGYVFDSWTENGEEIPEQGSPYTFDVDKDRNLVANFKKESCVGDIHRIQPKYHRTGVNDSIILVLIYPNPQYNYGYQWYKDGNPIPGATGQYYYQKGGVDDGVYFVMLSRGEGCSEPTKDYYVNQGRRLCIYPNPSRQGNGIVVEKDCEGPARLTIYTVDGRVLFSEMVTDNQVTLHLNLPIGIYVARLTDSEGYTKIGKLIIKN